MPEHVPNLGYYYYYFDFQLYLNVNIEYEYLLNMCTLKE